MLSISYDMSCIDERKTCITYCIANKLVPFDTKIVSLDSTCIAILRISSDTRIEINAAFPYANHDDFSEKNSDPSPNLSS